jgi:hypothetical protein
MMTTRVVDGLFDVYVGILRFVERRGAPPDSVTIAPGRGSFVNLVADDDAIRGNVKNGLPERGALAFVECEPPWPPT